ncbi:hypothetical protein niasHT_038195 [Heterodera trifolii]|uniref:Uncharacterized protein n=1 Tax=Heterodera trifolii TaxID=157864 RepID=A0ABD2ITP6_9BILA
MPRAKGIKGWQQKKARFYKGIERARDIGESTPALVAGHEAAHSVAVIKQKHMPQDFISATNIGTPENEGLTLATAVNPRNCSIKQIEALLVADMAGRAIELLLIGESHGDEGDVEEATVNAREV